MLFDGRMKRSATMVDMHQYETNIRHLVGECNKAMKSIDLKAYAFLEWIPYEYSVYTSESAFEREVINTYQLLGECGKYIWYNESYMKYLENGKVPIEKYKVDLFDPLHEMRLFYCHRFDPTYSQCFDSLCEFLKISEDDRDKYDFSISKELLIAQKDDLWENARKKLFDYTKSFLENYLDFLNKSKTLTGDFKKKFKEKWQNAIAKAYENSDSAYVTQLLENWIESEIESNLSGKDKIAAQQLLKDKQKIYASTKTIMNFNGIKHALSSGSIKDYSVRSVFETVMRTSYDRRNGRFN